VEHMIAYECFETYVCLGYA